MQEHLSLSNGPSVLMTKPLISEEEEQHKYILVCPPPYRTIPPYIHSPLLFYKSANHSASLIFSDIA